MNDYDMSRIGDGYGTDYADTFDTVDELMNVSTTETMAPVPQATLGMDPLPKSARPEAVRGRYILPNPQNGKSKSWQRMTNFIKLCEETYHLELWKQRNVAKGLAMMPGIVPDVARMDVKADKERLNRIVEKAMEAAGAYAMSNEGTELHKSTELADFAGGSLRDVPQHHRHKVSLYLQALRDNGLAVVPGMIERVTVSLLYDVAGKFDRIMKLADGTNCIFDVKTGDSIDLAAPSIAGQLAGYENGVNTHGVWDGRGYDKSVKVRTDIGLVLHLPSTRDEVTVHTIKLPAGHDLLADCIRVRDRRRVKAADVMGVFNPAQYGFVGEGQYWDRLEALNAANTMEELIAVADQARALGQWNERLATQARLLAKGL